MRSHLSVQRCTAANVDQIKRGIDWILKIDHSVRLGKHFFEAPLISQVCKFCGYREPRLEFAGALEAQKPSRFREFPTVKKPSTEIHRACKQKKGKRLRCRFPFRCTPGQIIMLTKVFTASDLQFYDFPAGVPVENWLSDSE